jgi:hypothetical protein
MKAGHNTVIAQMDEDRRSGTNPLAVKIVSTPVAATLSFSITPGTPMLKLPKPKTGLGGFVGPDGSLKVDV